jgi:hypothetical protein
MSAEIIQFGGTGSAKQQKIVNPKVRPNGESDQEFVARVAAAHRKFNERRVTCSIGDRKYRVTFDRAGNAERVEVVVSRVMHGRINVYYKDLGRRGTRADNEIIEAARELLAAGVTDANRVVPVSGVEELRTRQAFYREKAARHAQKAAEYSRLGEKLDQAIAKTILCGEEA